MKCPSCHSMTVVHMHWWRDNMECTHCGREWSIAEWEEAARIREQRRLAEKVRNL